MDTHKVIVMLPNARRHTIRVNPNKTILEILEEACHKAELSSNDYDLKHHNRILDLSQMFRFSGLPNNCLLEIVDATRKREQTDVVVCLHLEDGSRPQGTFNPSQPLIEVLEKLCPEKVTTDKNPVVIYTRKEIYGDALVKTTLKSLGITGGRAMVRVVDKNPDDLKIQANVYVPPKESQSTIEKPKSSGPGSSTKSAKAEAKSDFVKAIKQLKQETNTDKKVDIHIPMDVDKEETVVAETATKKYDWGTSGNTLSGNRFGATALDNNESGDESSEEPLEEMEAQICTLGERNAVLFSLNEAQRVPDDLPDAFFELTVQDLQYLLRDLKRQVDEQNDAPLLTEKLRELEKDKQVLNKLGQYKKSVIRVQFPNRLVLQGTFTPVETIETVENFVRNYIKDPNLKFYLFTIPPKKIIASDQTLVEAECVPTAILHFGADNEMPDEILKPELLSKLTSPDGAILAASRSRGLASSKRRTMVSQETSTRPGPSTGAIPKQPKAENFKQSTASHQPTGVIPKWFKPTGK